MGISMEDLISFADDTALTYSSRNWVKSEFAMEKNLTGLKLCFAKNHMLLSASKTNVVNFSLKQTDQFFYEVKYKCLNCMNLSSESKLSSSFIKKLKS